MWLSVARATLRRTPILLSRRNASTSFDDRLKKLYERARVARSPTENQIESLHNRVEFPSITIADTSLPSAKQEYLKAMCSPTFRSQSHYSRLIFQTADANGSLLHESYARAIAGEYHAPFLSLSAVDLSSHGDVTEASLSSDNRRLMDSVTEVLSQLPFFGQAAQTTGNDDEDDDDEEGDDDDDEEGDEEEEEEGDDSAEVKEEADDRDNDADDDDSGDDVHHRDADGVSSSSSSSSRSRSATGDDLVTGTQAANRALKQAALNEADTSVGDTDAKGKGKPMLKALQGDARFHVMFQRAINALRSVRRAQGTTDGSPAVLYIDDMRHHVMRCLIEVLSRFDGDPDLAVPLLVVGSMNSSDQTLWRSLGAVRSDDADRAASAFSRAALQSREENDSRNNSDGSSEANASDSASQSGRVQAGDGGGGRNGTSDNNNTANNNGNGGGSFGRAANGNAEEPDENEQRRSALNALLGRNGLRFPPLIVGVRSSKSRRASNQSDQRHRPVNSAVDVMYTPSVAADDIEDGYTADQRLKALHAHAMLAMYTYELPSERVAFHPDFAPSELKFAFEHQLTSHDALSLVRFAYGIASHNEFRAQRANGATTTTTTTNTITTTTNNNNNGDDGTDNDDETLKADDCSETKPSIVLTASHFQQAWDNALDVTHADHQYSNANDAHSAEAQRSLKAGVRPPPSNLNKHEKQLYATCVGNTAPVAFDDVGALDKPKQLLNELITLPLQRPDLFSKGILKRAFAGILLFGPPGTGKSMLARAVAAESGAAFMHVSAPDIFNMYVGESEKSARAIFSLARKLAPCVVFLDEVDGILSARSSSQSGSSSYRRDTLNELMMQWDGIASTSGVSSSVPGSDSEAAGRVIVLGATNRPGDLDEAILRRLPRRVLIPMPDKPAREKILHIQLRDDRLGEDVNVQQLADTMTEGMSGSDIHTFCQAAAMAAVREKIKIEAEVLRDPAVPEESVATSQSAPLVISLKHFEEAARTVRPSWEADGKAMEALTKWNDRYGDGGVVKKSNLGFSL